MSSKLDTQHVFFRPNDAEVEVRIEGPKGQPMRILITPGDSGVLVEVQADIDPELGSGDDRLAIDTLDVSWADFDDIVATEVAVAAGSEDNDDMACRERRYRCSVTFLDSEGDAYGTERVEVVAQGHAAAKRLALAATDASHYADSRVDFRREVYISGSDDIDDEDFEDEDDATDEEQ